MKKMIQVTVLVLILIAAAYLGYKYPALHPENSVSVYHNDYSNVDTAGK